jgi:hypothetical protein
MFFQALSMKIQSLRVSFITVLSSDLSMKAKQFRLVLARYGRTIKGKRYSTPTEFGGNQTFNES